ncbi:ATP-binding protein [Lacinutrix gracilariae]
MSFCFAQNDSTYYYFDNTTPLVQLEQKLKNLKDTKEQAFFKLIYFSRLREIDSMRNYLNILKNKHTIANQKKSKLLYFEGFLHKITNNDSLFFKKSNEAYQLSLHAKDSLTTLYSLSALAQSYDYNDDNYYNINYLNALRDKSTTYNNSYFQKIHLFLLGNYYLFRDQTSNSIKHFNQLLHSKFTKKDSTYILYTYSNLGVLYETVIENSDSAIYYYKKKLDFINKSPAHATPENYFNTYLNIATSYKSKGKLITAKNFYMKADSVKSLSNAVFNKSLIKENLAALYEQMNDFELAYKNLKEYNLLSDSLKTEEQHIAVAKIKEQYDNQRLRADHLESEAKRKQNQNLLIASLFVLLFGSITAFLINKNTKRKQLLAEQEQEIQKQKVSTLLKEQELSSIDAMIAGQEKERQRIANDLHDDLGGLMATVKLHFNSLKEKQSEDLFDRTNALLDQAYQKVRSIAHAKNSGVIAKQGLLKAIHEMANKISALNKIQIEVADHGLENRLENSLELTIFRIIQELTTNIIKHAQATQATISLTNHEDSLNIMIEDNGIGFNQKNISKKGMGIHSIDKRVEHLEGKMTIESEKNQGTTIIIDIPL